MTKKLNIRAILSFLLELLGLAAIVYGFWLIFPFLGFIIGGFAAILIGLAVDPPIRRENSGAER